MNKDCPCSYCKANVNEYFCISCKYNFNECESFYEFKENTQLGMLAPGIQLCPKCHPKNSKKDNDIFIAKTCKY
jgi:hypothetical protein